MFNIDSMETPKPTTFYITTDANGICRSACSVKQKETDLEFSNLPNDFLENIYHYKIQNGEIIKRSQEDISLEENKPTAPTDKERIEALEQALLKLMME